MTRPSLGLPPTARFVRRHVSVLDALKGHGFSDEAARELVATAARAGQAEVRFVLPATDKRPQACTVIVRRMRGNHAEEWQRDGAPGRLGASIEGGEA